MRRNIGMLSALFLLISCGTGQAVILGLDPQDWDTSTATTLILSPTVPSGNQVTNLPCLICGATQPQQPTGFGYNLFGNTGNETTVSFFSTATFSQPQTGLAIDQLGTGYSLLPGSPLLTALGANLTFSVGIDVNDTVNAQTLESFWFLNLTTHTVLGVYSPDPTEGTLIPDINNGTGFPDWTLSGLSLAGINPGDTVIFFARITGANDGPDSFFLIPNLQVDETPLPAAVWMFGGVLGLAGMVAGHRRRKQRSVWDETKTA